MTSALTDARALSRVDEAVAAIAAGRMVVVRDDEGRENEGDLILAAEHATPEALAFMVRYTSGVVCVALTGERLDALRVPQMVLKDTESQGTAFTVTVDLKAGITTGISASDRAATIRALADPDLVPEDLARPGHVFPLRAREGGVLTRPGHTEAAVDLARLAGLQPAGALAEIVNDDGSMARAEDLERFAREHGLLLISVSDIIRYRQAHEPLVTAAAQATIPTGHGTLTVHAYASTLDSREPLALVAGTLDPAEPPLVRVHAECLTGDVFGSRICACSAQLDLALDTIGRTGNGVVVYLRADERKVPALPHRAEAGHPDDGLPLDPRDCGIVLQILRDLGIKRVRLLTSDPASAASLLDAGLQVTEYVPLRGQPAVRIVGGGGARDTGQGTPFRKKIAAARVAPPRSQAQRAQAG